MTNITSALARKRNELEQNEKGFTLIELLVVVLIIGILTAIAVPIFLGQQNQAKDAAAQSDLGVAKVAYISYQTANAGAAPANWAALSGFGYVKSDSVTEATFGAAGSSFCLQNTSASGKHFGITHAGGVKAGTCSALGVFTATP